MGRFRAGQTGDLWNLSTASRLALDRTLPETPEPSPQLRPRQPRPPAHKNVRVINRLLVAHSVKD
jgi:hypothetical protein